MLLVLESGKELCIVNYWSLELKAEGLYNTKTTDKV